ncbi:MAG: RNA polymerase sigma factor [Spirochaetales bacterium]
MLDKNLLENNMQKMQTGSEEAFEVVYNITRKKVFFVILSIIKDYGLAEELMQDTYIKIRQTIGSYKIDTNASAWIITIAKNIAINAYNRRKHEVISADAENEYLFYSKTEETVLNNMMLKKLLNHLDEDERQIVILYSMGYKHREIAKELQKPLGTVLWIYNKAIKKLKNIGE